MPQRTNPINLEYVVSVPTKFGNVVIGLYGNGASISIGRTSSVSDEQFYGIIGQKRPQSTAFHSNGGVVLDPDLQLNIGGRDRSISAVVEEIYSKVVDLQEQTCQSHKHKVLDKIITYLTIPISVSVAALPKLIGVSSSNMYNPNWADYIAYGTAVALFIASMRYITRKDNQQSKLNETNNSINQFIDKMRVSLLKFGAENGIFPVGYGII